MTGRSCRCLLDTGIATRVTAFHERLFASPIFNVTPGRMVCESRQRGGRKDIDPMGECSSMSESLNYW